MTVWWRWMRDALSPTADEVERLIDPGPEGWRQHSAAATVPTELEIARLAQPVSADTMAACRTATAPSDIEVNRLLVGLRDPQRSSSPGLGWTRPLALAGAALAVAAVSLIPPSTDPLVTTLETSSWSAGQPVALNAAITVDGSATVQVTRTAQATTRVDLQDGAAWFEVDPHGDPTLRDLLVVAGDVKVRVQGTRFQVRRQADRIAVEVARGKVQVASNDDVFFLTAGQKWQATPDVGDGPLAQVRQLAEDLLPELPAPAVKLPEPPVFAPAPSPDKPLDAVVPRLDVALPAHEEALPAPTTRVDPPEPAPAPLQLVVDGQDPAKDQWAIIQKQIRLGEAQVLSALDRFLEQHGQTQYAEVARIERLQLLIERRPAVEALGELDRWIAAYPDSTRQVQVHGLRAGLALDQLQDCTAAEPSLDVVSSRGAGEDAATASAWLGSCALQDGDDAQAIAAFERALDQGLPPELESRVKDDLREARRRQRR